MSLGWAGCVGFGWAVFFWGVGHDGRGCIMVVFFDASEVLLSLLSNVYLTLLNSLL